MALELRLPGETDDAFRKRVERAGRVATVLVEACLRNRNMQAYIAEPTLPYSIESVRQAPTARVEYEQAIAVGDLGSCLSATRNKHWGDGPWIMPLERDDFFDSCRITYYLRENGLYNRRFPQRRDLMELSQFRYRA